MKVQISRKTFLIATAVLVMGGCRKPPPMVSAVLPLDVILRRPPDARTNGTRIWAFDDLPMTGLFYAEIKDELPIRYNKYAQMTVMVVSGKMDIVVEALFRYGLGPGSYVTIPRLRTYRIIRRGTQPLVVACLYFTPSRKLSWVNLQAPLVPIRR